MGLTQQELADRIIESLDQLERSDPASDSLLGYLYTPHPDLPDLIKRFQDYTAKIRPSDIESKEAGVLLEQIAAASFSRLKGVSELLSFQSAAAQYDLLVSGDDLRWSAVVNKLYMSEGRRSILVEAKARKNKLTDQEFSRLIGIIESHLSTAGLGVFFTIHGATGFPNNKVDRHRALRDCQLRQALYYAKSSRPIVVFDQGDIVSLNREGALPELIVRKIRALSGLSGGNIDPTKQPVWSDLPSHLKRFSPAKA